MLCHLLFWLLSCLVIVLVSILRFIFIHTVSSSVRHMFMLGTPRYSDSPQSGRRVADQLNRPTGSTDWKDAEPNPENQGAI